MGLNDIDQETKVPFIWVFIVFGFVIPILFGAAMWLQSVYSTAVEAKNYGQENKAELSEFKRTVTSELKAIGNTQTEQIIRLRRIEDKIDYIKEVR